MNKKILILLASILGVLSVILISIFGILPNTDGDVQIEQIEIKGYVDTDGNFIECTVFPDGKKVIVFEYIKGADINTIQLIWGIEPNDATNVAVNFGTSLENNVVTVTSFGLVTFYADTDVTIFLSSTDGSLVSDKVLILRKLPSDGEFED